MVKKIITEKIKDGKNFLPVNTLRVKLNNTINDRKSKISLRERNT